MDKHKGMMNYLKDNESKRKSYHTLADICYVARVGLVGVAIVGISALIINYALPNFITSFKISNKKEITVTVPEGATINSLVKNELGIDKEGNIFQRIWNKGRMNTLEESLWQVNEFSYKRSKTDDLQAGDKITVIDYNGNGQADW